MNSVAKVLVPNKEWIIADDGKKLLTVSKNKKGYAILHKGKLFGPKSLSELEKELGVELDNKKVVDKPVENLEHVIYNFPCSSKPYEPIYNVRKKLPLFAKSAKSKSQYCAGYYVIKFRKGWVKSFCPKLITLERYPYHGPYRTETEMKIMLNTVNKL
jgi:hypothetical protein